MSAIAWLLPWLALAACARERGERDGRPEATPEATHAATHPATHAATDPASGTASGTARWHFHFAPTAALDRMDAEACFHGRLPERLEIQIAAVREALTVLPDVAGPGHGDDRPGHGDDRSRGHSPGPRPPTAGAARPERGQDGIDRMLALTGLGPGGCVRYSVDLTRVTAPDPAAWKRQLSAYRYGDHLVLSPDYYLLRPVGALDEVTLTADFALPPGVQALVPWPLAEPAQTAGASPHTAGPYRIPPTTFTWRIHGALGRFDIHTLDVGGAELRVVVLGTDWKIERQALLDWVAQAGAAVADLYDGFPVSRAQALIVPTRGPGVVFGNAAQGGGNSVALLVGTEVKADALRDDWVAVHELLHLGMPMVDDAARWLSEGMATYYEPVMRARAGWITPARAWWLLHEGFQRGQTRGGGRTLAKESRDMDQTRAYWRVYWAGAAIALIADVALRQQPGAPTLDQQMRAIRACCLDAPRRWPAEDLLARIAVAGAVPDLADIAGRYTGAAAFPDLTATYAALGLRVDAGNQLVVSTSDDAARALRDAIMRPTRPAGAAP